jgi:WXG100 family type VII secretion target
MPEPLISNQATTAKMVQSFFTCQDECNGIQNGIDSAMSMLRTTWGGDPGGAAAQYQQAMAKWEEGFQKVRQGLNAINDSMNQYAQITGTTEDSAAGLSSGWGLGL